MNRLLAVAGLALLSLLTTGCLAAQTFSSARTLENGKTELTLIAGAGYAYTGSYYGRLPFPALGVQVRHGVWEGLELGASLGQSEIEGQLKVSLLRSETLQRGVSLSLAPAVGLNPLALSGGAGGPGLLVAELPVLIGFHLANGHEVTLAPIVRWNYGSGNNLLSAGGTLGVAFRLSELFVLTPEVGVMVPVLGPRPYEAYEGFVPSVGLGMTWGR